MKADRRTALGRSALRSVVVVYVVLLVAWPTGLVFKRAFQDGIDTFFSSLTSPDVQHALALTVTVAGWAVVINLVFGVAISLLLVRYRFPGRRILSVLIDVPLSVSPVVVGLALVLVYNARDGWFGTTLAERGFQIIFSTPGMIMATVFVALPLVVREVTPVLEEIGTDQEQAARSLGAGGFQTFWRITLPGIRWAIVYGLVLAVARSIGEFGAVKIVSGNITGQSQTATLAVEQTYQNFDHQAAYAIAALLAFTAMLCLIVVAILRPKEQH